MKALRHSLCTIAALMLAGVAGADPSKGIVTVAYDGIPRDVYPVAILEVDGKLQPAPLRETLWLEPGKHTLKLSARVQDGKTLLRGNNYNSRDKQKPGVLEIEVEAPEPYVSRGGHKLAAALDAFGIDPAGRVCLDAGASTGGFTDVLLQRGATRVYAVDVGRGQLAESLRRDPRVVSMERTNARELTDDSLPEPVSLASTSPIDWPSSSATAKGSSTITAARIQSGSLSRHEVFEETSVTAISPSSRRGPSASGAGR